MEIKTYIFISVPNPCINNPCGEDALCLLSGPSSFSCLCPDGTQQTSMGKVYFSKFSHFESIKPK